MPSPPHAAKLQGECVELRFLARAVRLGLTVSKPYGECSRYDFIVDNGAGLLRVQVKSVAVPQRGAYRIATSRGSRNKYGYRPCEIDFLAACVLPARAWYIIPVRAFYPRVTIWLRPHGPGAGHFEPYRDTWHLLG